MRGKNCSKLTNQNEVSLLTKGAYPCHDARFEARAKLYIFSFRCEWRTLDSIVWMAAEDMSFLTTFHLKKFLPIR